MDPATGESLCLLFYPHRNPRSLHVSGVALQKYYEGDAQEEDPPGSIRLEEMFFPALKALFQIPVGEFVRVKDLPLDEDDDKDALCMLLWELHLVQTKLM